MQIVIELDKSIVKGIKAKDFEFARGAVRNFQATIADAIRNGTVLPDHGRLIDADAFKKDNSELWGCDFIHPKYCDTLADLVSNAPTILEAWGNEK